MRTALVFGLLGVFVLGTPRLRADELEPEYRKSIEKGLDERGYLLPGLGDAGDRLFGTV